MERDRWSLIDTAAGSGAGVEPSMSQPFANADAARRVVAI